MDKTVYYLYLIRDPYLNIEREDWIMHFPTLHDIGNYTGFGFCPIPETVFESCGSTWLVSRNIQKDIQSHENERWKILREPETVRHPFPENQSHERWKILRESV